ncbi:unnamed protein product [Schistosoma mattheei]|uniref:Cyclin-dependent kinase 2-associated protein 2 n=3 Tax=Schistosoma TaxID=6181 RepID=A0AA85BNH9_9TREM|nr:unnamed protein product [Schistosoma mattheei]
MNEDTEIYTISVTVHIKWKCKQRNTSAQARFGHCYWILDKALSIKSRMTQNTSIPVSYPMMPPMDDLNKYAHLLQVIEEMGRDIKPTYANNKNAAERLKKNIHTARILVRECVSELERVMKA